MTKDAVVISGLVGMPKASRGTPGRCEAGCVWVASRSRDLQRPAKLPREIIQSIEGFDLRERTLNLRVDGSIPSWLTIPNCQF
jgi:hypothetical protein